MATEPARRGVGDGTSLAELIAEKQRARDEWLATEVDTPEELAAAGRYVEANAAVERAIETAHNGGVIRIM